MSPKLEQRSRTLLLRGRCGVVRVRKTALQTSRLLWNSGWRNRTGSGRIRQRGAEGTRNGASRCQFNRFLIYVTDWERRKNDFNTMC